MSNTSEVKALEKDIRDLELFIKGRQYMIYLVKKDMNKFLFDNYDGEFKDYLRAKNVKYQFRIDTYIDECEDARDDIKRLRKQIKELDRK